MTTCGWCGNDTLADDSPHHRLCCLDGHGCSRCRVKNADVRRAAMERFWLNERGY